MRTVPRTTIELRLFVWLSEKAFLTVDRSKDGDYNTLLNYSLETRLTHKPLNEQANRILPKPKLAVTSNLPHANPRQLVYGKERTSETTGDLAPKRRGCITYSCSSKCRQRLLVGPHVRIKPGSPSWKTNEQTNMPIYYCHEPVDALKFLFKWQ